MIVIKLKGGLGNQLFQYAFGLHLSRKTNRELCLDLSELLNPNLGETQRKYELYPYATSARIISIEELKKLNIIKSALFKNFLSILNIGFNNIRYFKEADFKEALNLRNRNFNALIFDGYWQKERYLKEVESVLKKQIQDYDVTNLYAINIEAHIKRTTSVSLHIRRGDYISNPRAAKFHSLCSIAYYKSAMEYLCGRLMSPHFFIFTDDPQWAIQNIPKKYMFTVVSGLGGINHHDELYLMSQCQHNVISNSSFSWWGAWLNGNIAKNVIAPTIWHKNSNGGETKDLLPNTWITM